MEEELEQTKEIGRGRSLLPGLWEEVQSCHQRDRKASEVCSSKIRDREGSDLCIQLSGMRFHEAAGKIPRLFLEEALQHRLWWQES